MKSLNTVLWLTIGESDSCNAECCECFCHVNCVCQNKCVDCFGR